MNFIGHVARLTVAAMLVAGLGTTSYAQTADNPPAMDNASAVVEGQVAAAGESGELLLRTDDGLIAFLVPPKEIQGISIGETVRVPISDNASE
jgi:hypothetical protein